MEKSSFARKIILEAHHNLTKTITVIYLSYLSLNTY